MLDIKAFDTKGLKNEDSILKAAADIGTGALTDVSVMVRFATFLFVCGLGFKAGTFKPNAWDMGKVFAAFNDAFRGASNGFRKELSDSSIDTWVSAFGAYYEAGKFGKYDLTAIAEKTMLLDGSFTSRGAKLRRVMKDHPDSEPTATELAAILTPAPKADANPMGTLAARWALTIGDKRVAKNEAKAKEQADANPRIRLAWLAVQEAIAALEKAAEPVSEGTGMTPAEEIAMLKAKIAAATSNGSQPQS